MPQEVLIIDDDPSLLRLLQTHLEVAGYRVHKAADGAEGLNQIRSTGARLALVDYDMPGMTGVDFCRAVRADKAIPFTHLIVVTAHAGHALMIDCLDAGADDFLAKPFDRGELLARLRAGERTVRLHEELDRSLRLKAERDHLRQAVSAMEQVLGVVGHELRTPLAALRAISELLLTGEAKQSQDHNVFLRSLHSEVVRMSDTVDTLLEAARLNSGQARWNWSQFSIEQVCAEAMETARPLIDPQRVKLVLAVDPPRALMLGDADAVRRLVLNLLSNSQKNTFDGRICIEARVSDEAGIQWTEFRVSDTGRGIPPEIISRLGEAFSLNSGLVGSNYVEGTGLGLAICKGIVAAHAGLIQVESRVERGTTINVRMRADLAGPVAGDDKLVLFAPCSDAAERSAA